MDVKQVRVLHVREGEPWAVPEFLQVLGYNGTNYDKISITVVEHVGINYTPSTLQDLIKGSVTLSHDATEGDPYLRLKISSQDVGGKGPDPVYLDLLIGYSNKSNNPATAGLVYTPTNDKPVVSAGATQTIDYKSSLSIANLFTASDTEMEVIRYDVVKAEGGRVLLGLKPISSFSTDEALAGNIRFEHNGVVGITPSITVRAVSMDGSVSDAFTATMNLRLPPPTYTFNLSHQSVAQEVLLSTRNIKISGVDPTAPGAYDNYVISVRGANRTDAFELDINGESALYFTYGDLRLNKSIIKLKFRDDTANDDPNKAEFDPLITIATDVNKLLNKDFVFTGSLPVRTFEKANSVVVNKGPVITYNLDTPSVREGQETEIFIDTKGNTDASDDTNNLGVSVTDDTSPDTGILYTVLNTKNGYFTLDGRKTTQFTQAHLKGMYDSNDEDDELNNHRISFVHDGNPNHIPSYILKVTDNQGASTVVKKITPNLVLINDAPVLFAAQALMMKEEVPVILNSNYFSYRDEEFSQGDQSKLSFRFVDPGTASFSVTKSNAAFDLSSDTFTYADLQAGRIAITGHSNSRPSIAIIATDENGTDSVPVGLNIKYTATNQAVVETSAYISATDVPNVYTLNLQLKDDEFDQSMIDQVKIQVDTEHSTGVAVKIGDTEVLSFGYNLLKYATVVDTNGNSEFSSLYLNYSDGVNLTRGFISGQDLFLV
ncbi:MAG: Cadherin-like [Verrucomicrobiota bacterium]|jgi:hypothetical protein